MPKNLRLTLPATELLPGDLVLNPTTGFRHYSVFDRSVEHDDQAVPLAVTVWPAHLDVVNRGLDERLELRPDAAGVWPTLEVLRQIEHAYCTSCGVDLLVRAHVATCSAVRS